MPRRWQWYLGPEGSGAPFHSHCPAFNGLAYGEKRWFLYPPGHARAAYSSRHPRVWLEEALGEIPEEERPFACTQRPGEVVYVPGLWSHSVLNTRESIGFAVEISADC